MVLSILPREKQGLPSVPGLKAPTKRLQGTGPGASPDHQPCRVLDNVASGGRNSSSSPEREDLGALGRLEPLITQ